MDFVESVALCALVLRGKKPKPQRRFWVHPLVGQRLLKGQFHKIYEDLRLDPKKFFNYFRMSCKTFDELLSIIGPRITYQNTTMRMSVSPKERLSVTLK